MIYCRTPSRGRMQQEAHILEYGAALTERETALARQLGVQNSARVRLLAIDEMPRPQQSELRAAALQSGFFAPGTQGMTLGAGVFVARAAWRELDLVAHELVHVAQYESLGIEEFLRRYLRECLTVGYWNAPLEIEAREESARVLKLQSFLKVCSKYLLHMRPLCRVGERITAYLQHDFKPYLSSQTCPCA